MLEVDGLVTLTLNASGRLGWRASLQFHTLPFCSCRLSLHQLSGIPASVTACLILHPIVKMMARGWIPLSLRVKYADYMTVIFYTEEIFLLFYL